MLRFNNYVLSNLDRVADYLWVNFKVKKITVLRLLLALVILSEILREDIASHRVGALIMCGVLMLCQFISETTYLKLPVDLHNTLIFSRRESVFTAGWRLFLIAFMLSPPYINLGVVLTNVFFLVYIYYDDTYMSKLPPKKRKEKEVMGKYSYAKAGSH